MKIKFLVMFFAISNFFNILAQNFVIKRIESFDLSQEKMLFEKTSRAVCEIDSSHVMFNQILQDTFQVEEKDYLDFNSKVLFFHALLDDQVIGYISFDQIDEYHVHIRQLVVDTEVFTVDIVKELLCMVFRNYLQAKSITISCYSCFYEMIEILKSFGFAKVEPMLRPSLQFCSMYELKMNFKCKICELLYPNIWADELNEDAESKEFQEED